MVVVVVMIVVVGVVGGRVGGRAILTIGGQLGLCVQIVVARIAKFFVQIFQLFPIPLDRKLGHKRPQIIAPQINFLRVAVNSQMVVYFVANLQQVSLYFLKVLDTVQLIEALERPLHRSQYIFALFEYFLAEHNL
ncbi:hypothetical protein BpHYR1_025617 [Brachionus plicatilis]|uniref:Uncharacterized protein n=1 Tax=Brachionus plicatilis TaxID=10195 RepID=A0A3M7SU14_BRAPC|nr:hypothetical protein BpHYR1_025617 [Brachionus plicatilis]